MALQHLLNPLIKRPKRLFLIDSLGAGLSVVMLLAVLPPLEHLFGMPSPVLLMLAVPAGMFALYSAGCYLFAGPSWRLLLRIIAVANLLYCCATVSLLVVYYDKLTPLGIACFALEIGVICALVWLERQAACVYE